MQILGVIQRVAKVVGVAVPDAVFASDDRTALEFGVLANQMAERISNDHDWQRLRRIFTLTGNGTQESFGIPYDYSRITYGTSLRTTEGPLCQIIDPDVWLDWQMREIGPSATPYAWTLLGDRFHVTPTLPSGKQVKLWYQSDRIVRSGGTLAGTSFPYTLPFELADSGEYGDAQTEFLADDDHFQLDWKLLEAGIIWQWKANKGLPYEEDMQTYELLKAKVVMRERGPRTLYGAGRSYWSDDADLAYPWTLRG